MQTKKLINATAFFIIFLMLICLNSGHAIAQTWQALPPYNFLWPLWSPALSPVDPVTGEKVPIVSDLYPSTVLPVQPGIAWNYIFDYPYFLYNSPLGLQYYDVIYGINPWPPSYSLDPVKGNPIPITLPVGYQFLPPTDTAWIQENLSVANQVYLAQYPAWALAAYNSTLPAKLVGLDPWQASLIYPTPSLSSLLTTAQLLGYTPPAVVTASPSPAVVAPTPTLVAPAPTLVASIPTLVAPAPTPIVPAPLVTTPTSIVPPAIFATNFLALSLIGLI